MAGLNPSERRPRGKGASTPSRKLSEPIFDKSKSPSYPPPSTPQSVQDHPANNVRHPGGNRGLSDATLPLGTPMSWPSSTGEYQDAIG
jgi:hypothetical protein